MESVPTGSVLLHAEARRALKHWHASFGLRHTCSTNTNASVQKKLYSVQLDDVVARNIHHNIAIVVLRTTGNIVLYTVQPIRERARQSKRRQRPKLRRLEPAHNGINSTPRRTGRGYMPCIRIATIVQAVNTGCAYAILCIAVCTLSPIVDNVTYGESQS